MTQVPRFDLSSLGETMLRLSVPAGERLESSHTLALDYGGAESNVCVALAGLGRRCAWGSRLTQNALGDGLLRALRADGVDTSAVLRCVGERIGTYYVEFADAPRAIQVTYDRAYSAASRMAVADVDWDCLIDTRLLHLTGITAALSTSCYEVVSTAITRARSTGVAVSFDVNYRAKLWDPSTAAERLRPLITDVDILFCKSADASLLFGCNGSPREQMDALAGLTRASTIYCTFGASGAALLDQGRWSHLPALPVKIVDRLGSGDAFAAGALDGVLDGDASTGLQRGLALAAIALSLRGDRVVTTRAELDAVLAASGADIQR